MVARCTKRWNEKVGALVCSDCKMARAIPGEVCSHLEFVTYSRTLKAYVCRVKVPVRVRKPRKKTA